MLYRFSNKFDKEVIERIWRACFNISGEPDFLKNYENGRYLLCEYNGEVVGIASLTPETLYTYALTWVCVLPEYRGTGIATELIRRLVLLTGNCRITAEAWKTGLNGDRAHLDSALRKNGFELKIPDAISYIKGITCQSYMQCAQRRYCTESGMCTSDIYVREHQGLGSNVRLLLMNDNKIYINIDNDIESGIYAEFSCDCTTMVLKNITNSNKKYLSSVIGTLKNVVDTCIYMEVHSSVSLPDDVRSAVLKKNAYRKFECNFWCDAEECNYTLEKNMKCYFDLYRV